MLEYGFTVTDDRLLSSVAQQLGLTTRQSRFSRVSHIAHIAVAEKQPKQYA
ncbi:MAG: hypothetical protein JOZ49_05570 [Mycolicibacterium sp.]|nr:hypothetical protein [Mycolicibacterium sp.]